MYENGLTVVYLIENTDKEKLFHMVNRTKQRTGHHNRGDNHNSNNTGTGSINSNDCDSRIIECILKYTVEKLKPNQSQMYYLCNAETVSWFFFFTVHCVHACWLVQMK